MRLKPVLKLYVPWCLGWKETAISAIIIIANRTTQKDWLSFCLLIKNYWQNFCPYPIHHHFLWTILVYLTTNPDGLQRIKLLNLLFSINSWKHYTFIVDDIKLQNVCTLKIIEKHKPATKFSDTANTTVYIFLVMHPISAIWKKCCRKAWISLCSTSFVTKHLLGIITCTLRLPISASSSEMLNSLLRNISIISSNLCITALTSKSGSFTYKVQGVEPLSLIRNKKFMNAKEKECTGTRTTFSADVMAKYYDR